MKLKEYLRANKLTQNLFIRSAELKTGHKFPQGTLAKYLLEQRYPRKKELNIIYQATDGLVTPNDFYLD
jgi:hypothetical protein|tara:strand:- start:109 stop:315 length:207 start_codon:yes stop_codon:yes gene_type:complete